MCLGLGPRCCSSEASEESRWPTPGLRSPEGTVVFVFTALSRHNYSPGLLRPDGAERGVGGRTVGVGSAL